MKDLKERTIRGGAARMSAQAANFVLRLCSLMVLARLLGPKDFGLVGMVTAFTGVLNLFRDFGLSSAAIQRETVSEEQKATLFWVNVLVGALLGLATAAMAPVIAAFYHEPRLIAVTGALAAGFVFNALGVQHSALLQREMRFTALAVINTIALIVSAGIGIASAEAGYGYWALVAMTVSLPIVSTAGFWLTTGWIPGRPKRRVGIRSMMRFGGILTLYGLVAYIATNLEKVLIGRFWGADVIGIYGRSYQLVNLPADNLNSAVGEVAFPALSRLQNDPSRLRSYFLKGYSLVLALTLPLTIACALFADDVIYVLLGPKWKAAVPIFRLLTPTILVFAIAAPLSWLLSSMGRVERLLKMTMVISPILIAGYAIAVPYGPSGVAFAYSAVMLAWVVPLVAWSVHGTVITGRDMLRTVGHPLASGMLAGGIAFGARLVCGNLLSPLPRLVLESLLLLLTFSGMLLFVSGQKSLYLDLLRGLKHPSVKEKSLASV
jgi:O-antigen/teichoic acid export membrane protein